MSNLLTGWIAVSKQSWSVSANPGANAQATVTKAAGGAGIRHVCTTLNATFVAGTVAPAAVNVSVFLRDGASGAGTIVWQGVMALPATAGQGSAPISITGLFIMGSANTPMTLEFSAAGGANTFEAVSMTGFDLSDF